MTVTGFAKNGPSGEIRASPRELLNAPVIRHVDVASQIQRNAFGTLKLPIPAPVPAPASHESTGAGELLDAVVVAARL